MSFTEVLSNKYLKVFDQLLYLKYYEPTLAREYDDRVTFTKEAVTQNQRQLSKNQFCRKFQKIFKIQNILTSKDHTSRKYESIQDL